MSNNDEEDLYAGPLCDRIESANWKVRRAAYEQLTQLMKESVDNAIFYEYASAFKKIVADKNAAAQEKGLEALLTWIDRSEDPTSLNSLAGSLIEKCFGGRPNTKTKAVEALVLFVEVDKNAEAIVSALLEGATNKQWKISQLSIATITQILKTFGAKVVPIKLILKNLAKLFEDSNKAVRDEAQNLAVEIYRWIGDAMKPSIDALRPAQVKELGDAFAKLPKGVKAVPEKYLRCEQPQDDEEVTETKSAASQGGEEEEEGEEKGLDAFDLAEPVDILAKVPEDWAGKLSAPKWKDRLEQMDFLVNLLSAPRLKPGDYRELAKTLKTVILKDANIAVVTKAIQASGMLAKGLRQDFSGEAKLLVPALLGKFKEKKASVVAAINEALDLMTNICFTIAEITEEVKEAVDDKVPQVREQTLIFVTRFIVMKTCQRAIVGTVINVLAPIFLSAMDDGIPGVREAAYKAFAQLVGKVGERPMSPYLSKLDGIKEKKVKENYPEKIFTGTLVLPKAGGASNGAGGQKTGQKAPPKKTTSAPAMKKPAQAAPKKAPTQAAKDAPKRVASSANLPKQEEAKPAPRKASSGASIPVVEKKVVAPIMKKIMVPKKVLQEVPPPAPLTPEEALEQAASIFPASVLDGLSDGAWKNRLAAITELIAATEPLLETRKDDPSFIDMMMRLLEQKPGFKDANIQVVGKLFDLVGKLSASPCFDARLADLVLEELVNKIGDIKLRIPSLACLNAIAEAVGVSHVITQVCKYGEASKNPKVANETLTWLTTAIEDFGFQDTNIDVKILVDYMKGSLESSNAMVRSSAVKGFGKMFVYLGESLKEHLTEVKPALMSTIDKEFEKWANAKPSPPSRTVRQNTAAPRMVEVEVMEEIEVVDEEATAAAVAAAEEAPAPASAKPAASKPVASSAKPVSVPKVEEPLEEEMPVTPQEIVREDISGKLTTALLADLSNNDWKVKKEALDKILQILKAANMCVLPNGIPVLMSKLKDRLQDSNKNLVAYTLKLLGPVATAVGPHIDRYSKHILPLILANYTDQKNTVRDITTATLDAWVAQSGLDTFIPYLPKAISVDNSVARKEVLCWLVKHQATFSKTADVKPLVKPVITCLQDRTPEVRHQAELVLAELLSRVGLEAVKQYCNDLKQSAKMQVVGVLKKLLDQQRAQQPKPVEAPQPKQAAKPAPTIAAPAPAAASNSSPQGKSSTARVEEKARPKSPAPLSSVQQKKSSLGSSRPQSPAVTQTKPRESFGSSAAVRDEEPPQKAQPPLIPNEDKKLRQKQDKNIGAENAVGDGGWAFKGAPTPAHVQHLAEQMKKCVNAELHAKLFCKDFRKHREALTELAMHVETYKELETKQNLDVLLKYATLRLYDANESTLKKTVDFLRVLFDVLDSADYHLSDYEAGVIVPILLDLTAQGENLAATSTDLLRSFPRIYPASKLFDWYLELGLEAKSPRTKVETLTLCGELLRRQGLTVCSNPALALPRFAVHIASSVAAIRNAALTSLQQAYLHIGEDLWGYLPNLSETQRALLNQRLNGDSPARPTHRPAESNPVPRIATPQKETSTHAPVSPRQSSASPPKKMQSMPVLSTPTKSTPTRKTPPTTSSGSISTRTTPSKAKTPVKEQKPSTTESEEKANPKKSSSGAFSLELDKLEIPELPKKSILKKPSSIPAAKVDLPQLTGPTPALPTRHRTLSNTRGSASASSEEATASPLFSYIITWTSDISSGDPAVITKACSDIQEKIENLGEAPFVGTIDGLLVVLTEQLRVSFTSKDFSVRKNKECKYLINVLLKIFQRPKIAVVVGRPAVAKLYSVMFEAFAVIDAKMAKAQRAPSDTPPSDAALTGISKGLGILIKAVLKNTDMTASFGVLFESLDNCLSDKELSKRIGGVVIKSLLVILRYLQENNEAVDMEQLLYDVHVLLEKYQQVYVSYVSKSKPKSGESTPGEEAPTGVKLTEEAMKFLKALISHLVKVNGRSISKHLGKVPADKYPTPLLVRIIDQTLKIMYGQSADKPEEDQENSVPAASNSDEPLTAKSELLRIFKALQTKGSQQQEALKQLHQFKKAHPEIDVSTYLNSASPQFQAYITRGMMSFNDKENTPNQSNQTADEEPDASANTDSSFMEKLRALQKKYGVSNSKAAVPPVSATTTKAIQALPRSRAGSVNTNLPAKAVVPDLDLGGEGPNLANLQKRIRSMGAQSSDSINIPNGNSSSVVVSASEANPSSSSSSTSSSSTATSLSSSGNTSLDSLKRRLEMIKQNSSS